MSSESASALPFRVAGASVSGAHHRLAGRNNQDALAWVSAPDGIVAAVADGCGSAPHSELGAQFGARAWVRLVRSRLERGESPADDAFWTASRQELLAELGSLSRALDARPRAVIADALLFTLVGAIVLPTTTWTFSSGDGLIRVNEETTVLGPFPGNEPPYLAYALFPPEHRRFPDEALQFQRRALPTSELSTLVLGTDGLAELEREPLEALWASDTIFENPDALRRRLEVLHRRRREGAQGVSDDTTLVVLRRTEWRS